MYFTQEDYLKIENWLYKRTVKDTDFPAADPIDGTESIPIIQDKKNKVIGMNDFVKEVANMKLPDFYNVSSNSKKYCLTLKEAISLVPIKQRKIGLTITYNNEFGNWVIYQFKGSSLNQWDSLNYWDSIIKEAIEEYLFFPDEEDITGVRDGNRTFLKFRDKDYNPEDFSGMGRVILRKNLVGTEACSIDDEDHLLNILKQDMIDKENTVYIVQYDFDLNGGTISIPKGCTLWFQGGSINNGNIYLQETAILGAFEFADMGDATLFGKFNTGQIMTFSDDSYKAKEGGYFKPTVKNSSATKEEDAKQDKETFYDIDNDAYSTVTRQELRWWNGEEWILILDITDYDEIKSIISNLIDKHNAEMSACYKYFKARCYALELRMGNAEKTLVEHGKRLDKHDERLDDHDLKLTNHKERLDKHDERLDSHDTKLSKHEERLDNHDTDLTNHKSKLDDHDTQLNNHKSKLDSHDTKLQEHDTKLTEHSDTLTNVDTRLTEHDNKLKGHDDDIDGINTKLSGVDTKLSEVDNSLSNVDNRLTGIDDSLSGIGTDISNINTDITDINNSINNINTNITNIEGDVTNINTDITNIKSDINNLDTSVTNIKGDITNINSTISNIETNITNTNNSIVNIKTEIESNVDKTIDDKLKDLTGFITSVEVNGEEYTPDENGKVGLPDYPSSESIKDIVTEPVIIQTIIKYINREVVNYNGVVTPKSNPYIIPDSDIPDLDHKMFMVAPEPPNVEKDETTINEYNIRDYNGNIINLYNIGFNPNWIKEGEWGIVYSSDKEYIENLTLDKFNLITSNSKTVGKILFKTFSTNQEDADGNIPELTVLDTVPLNNILDSEQRYYKVYINIPSRNIFYSNIDITSISGIRARNDLDTINYNSIFWFGIGNLGVRRRVKISDGVITQGVEESNTYPSIEFTIELDNLYVIENSKATLEYVLPGEYIRRHCFNIMTEKPASANKRKSNFEKVSDNKYKVVFKDVNLFSYNYPYCCLLLHLSTSPTNRDSNFFIPDNCFYKSTRYNLFKVTRDNY